MPDLRVYCRAGAGVSFACSRRGYVEWNRLWPRPSISAVELYGLHPSAEPTPGPLDADLRGRAGFNTESDPTEKTVSDGRQ